MLTVYFLPVETLDGTHQVAGISLIHDAILQTTEDPGIQKLLMDTTLDEHADLITLALNWREATPQETDFFHQTVIPFIPNPDIIRAREILASHPGTIEPPELTELIRILTRLQGLSS